MSPSVYRNNILRQTDILDNTAPLVPLAVARDWSHRAFKLHNFVVSRMQHEGLLSISLSSEQVRLGTGIHRQDLGSVHGELSKVCRVTTTKGKPTVYTLLNPVKAEPVRHLSYLGRDTLSREQIRFYFLHRLREWELPFIDTENGIEATCPFCRQKGLQIRLPAADQLDGGVWTCHACGEVPVPLGSTLNSHSLAGKSGNILHFEMELKGDDNEQAARLRVERTLQEMYGRSRKQLMADLERGDETKDIIARIHAESRAEWLASGMSI